jgi:hypothetical protein
MPISQAHDIDVDLLEPLLRQLVDLIGLPATMAIVDACGGTLLNIPRQADQNETLVRLVGPEKAAILGRELGPDRLLIPKAGPALQAARNRRILAELKTRSVRQVARDFGLGERQVWYIKSQSGQIDDSTSLSLFD